VLDAGHELGPHSWDHRRWQDRLDRLSPEQVRGDVARAVSSMHAATGADVVTSAAPAWLTCEEALRFQESFNLRFASDCRGRGPFYPALAGEALRTLQVPATLPTLDEMLGEACESPAEYYAEIARRIAETPPEACQVLTVHAETEGRFQAADFDRFLGETSGPCEWVPLGSLADERRGNAPRCRVTRATIKGRHGEVSMQGPEDGPGGGAT
jgi:peptidoglycan/xylan/chitin deacetylase (PgdA/CDA1 family)